MTHRVLIIDDHPLLRRGLGQLLALESARGLELVGEAGNGRDGLRLAEALRPDVVLLDLDMPGMGGVDTLKALRQAGHAMPVIMLTVSDRDRDIAETLRAGASGYLLKDMEPEQLIEALTRAVTGEIVISPALTATLARAMDIDTRDGSTRTAGLTPREREILALLAQGHSNKMIARLLGISEGTAKIHIRNLLRKTRLRSRVEAAVWAVQNGFG